jgi:hypothetical protein
VGLIDRIRSVGYTDLEPDFVPAWEGAPTMSLAEAADEISGGSDVLIAARNFLDQVNGVDRATLQELIEQRPSGTGDQRADAMLGALAEYVATRFDLCSPAWAGEPARFLDRFWFVSKEPAFRAISLVQSPAALKRRGILWPERSMQRV